MIDHSGITTESEKDVEGLGEDVDSSWGEYPIDTVLIRNENRTVYDVLRRIEQGSYIMDPDFQRDFIWPDDKQSKLIESVLMRIPLPVFYLAEDQQGKLIVVDGLQRLSTFKRFVDDHLKLKLPEQKELNSKKFKDLSAKLQNRIEDCNLILYVIDAKVPERARLDIFERVNAGVPLTRQQMRNCLYMGPATRFLKTESKNELFLKATGKSLKSSTMRDREFVNRFCAFQLLDLNSYRGDMDEFLARGLKLMNGLCEDELTNLSNQFHRSLRNNYGVFGDHAFRKSLESRQSRTVINASLWDVLSTELSNYQEGLVEVKSDEIESAIVDLMKGDETFAKSITSGTNALDRVTYRFKAIRMVFQEVFNDKSA